MRQAKDEAISKLQELSDGLYGIAQINEKIQENIESIEEQKTRIERAESYYAEFESAVKDLQGEYDDIVSQYNEEKEGFDEKVRQKLKRTSNTWIVVLVITLVVVIVPACIVSGLFLIGLLVPIGLLAAFFVTTFSKKTKIEAELNAQLKQYEELAEKAQEALRSANGLRPQKIKNKKETIASSNNEISRLNIENESLNSEAEASHKELETKYSGLLAVDDWDCVDYIIFCMQSGRADTIKDSLPFADARRRHDEIINTAIDSAQDIIDTIDSQIGSLRHATDDGFYKLTDKVDSVGKDMVELQEYIVALLGMINRKTDNIGNKLDASIAATTANTAAVGSLESSVSSSMGSAKSAMSSAEKSMNAARDDFKKNKK